MAIIAKGVLSARIAGVRKAKDDVREDIQEVLISVAYQATMGNPNYANDLLEAVRDTVHIKGLILWMETFAPLRLIRGKLVINKGMAKTMHVTAEADFAPYEAEMRKSKWWEMAPPQKAKSAFDGIEYIDAAMKRVAKKLNDEGQPDLSKLVQQVARELATKEAYKVAVEQAAQA